MEMMVKVWYFEDRAFQKWDLGDKIGCVEDLRRADVFLEMHLISTAGKF
jgi:hypothetical protein